MIIVKTQIRDGCQFTLFEDIKEGSTFIAENFSRFIFYAQEDAEKLPEDLDDLLLYVHAIPLKVTREDLLNARRESN